MTPKRMRDGERWVDCVESKDSTSQMLSSCDHVYVTSLVTESNCLELAVIQYGNKVTAIRLVVGVVLESRFAALFGAIWW